MTERSDPYLSGHVLVAMPGMPDNRFARSVIYLCKHSADGAMGLVVNRRAERLNLHDLMITLKIIGEGARTMPPTDVPVVMGGPVEPGRGFVLHTEDFQVPSSTIAVDAGICLTATTDILVAIARGKGPRQAVLALGCATWSPGQLEAEIQANAWLNCAGDCELVLSADPASKYDRALRKIGVDPSMLSSGAGHA